jgi:hypothetical protein
VFDWIKSFDSKVTSTAPLHPFFALISHSFLAVDRSGGHSSIEVNHTYS